MRVNFDFIIYNKMERRSACTCKTLARSDDSDHVTSGYDDVTREMSRVCDQILSDSSHSGRFYSINFRQEFVSHALVEQARQPAHVRAETVRSVRLNQTLTVLHNYRHRHLLHQLGSNLVYITNLKELLY